MIRLAALALAASTCLVASPARSHPHVWIEAKASFVWDGSGRISSIRHVWRFDPGYSAFMSQGLDKDGDGKVSEVEASELTDRTVSGLVETEYFTYAKESGARVRFGKPTSRSMEFHDGVMTLSFEIPFREPFAVSSLSVEIMDPTYFVSYTMASGDAAAMSGAPASCAASITRPKGFDKDTAERLARGVFDAITSNDLLAGMVNKVDVVCPEGSATR